jgi:hypothetical protein
VTSALLDDDRLGAARIVSHVALRPVRRFGRLSRIAARSAIIETLSNRRFRRAKPR